jgi:hypothetical protein
LLVGDVLEEAEELVVLALRDRVVLVVVAAGALHRQAEEHGRGGVNAVGHVLDAVLLRDDPALGVMDLVAEERRRHPLVERRVRQ